MALSRGSGKLSESIKADFKQRRGRHGNTPRIETQKHNLKKPHKHLEAWEQPGLTSVARILAFLEAIAVTKGLLEGTRMRLLPNQRDFIQRVYGSEQPVTIGVLSAPRGSGKTGLIAGLGLCHLLGPEAQ